MHIASRLERLVTAFEAHGEDVRSNLLPGASPAELDAVEAELGVRLPQAYRDLYGWSAGCRDRDADPALVFRDNPFLSLSDAVAIRRQVIETYGAGPEDSHGVDLAVTAPLAEFMGSTYLVVCGPHHLEPASENPVIGAFHGVEVYFLSIESMIETCIEWVEQPGYEPAMTAPHEMSIWLKHNPGVFA